MWFIDEIDAAHPKRTYSQGNIHHFHTKAFIPLTINGWGIQVPGL
jgi:hypothetical protein